MKRTFLLAILSGATLFAQTAQEKLAADQAKLAAAQARTAASQAELAARQEKLQTLQSQAVFGTQTVQFVSSLVNGPTVKAAPYSAEAVTETTQTLSDGNRIEQRTSSKQYRDGEGRERREESSGMNVVFITDPVAQISYTLRPDTKTAERSSMSRNFVLATKGQLAAAGTKVTIEQRSAPNGVVQTLDQTVDVKGPPQGFGFVNAQSMMIVNPALGATEPKFEDLGTRTVEGVQAKGTRSTMTIAAGQIGNVRPIEIVDENWYSPELQMTVMTRHSDPRSGETSFKLTNVLRIEPVRQLFELPPDYTLVADRVTGAAKLADEKLKLTQDIVKAFDAAQSGRKE
jgi:hypothetical protein